MIVCCLERGCLHKVQLTPKDVAMMANCVLSALDAQTAMLYLAVGIWSAVQASLYIGCEADFLVKIPAKSFECIPVPRA